ncbi:hypothetical protein [Brevundimonas aurifodinae]|uniref:Uracil-DNA glycosylase-like domain-containing protein n=1 Tax=Brevundimonas aurifodinae TaxID=1508312 RepID=A0ABV1NMY8_9CAUL
MAAAANPRFSPWHPSGDPRIDRVRLLVVGESHYEEPPQWLDDGRVLPSDYTVKIIEEWGLTPEKRHPFFAGIFECLTGDEWVNEPARLADFWQNLLFYNYVQRLVKGGARNAPSATDWAFSHPRFRPALEMLKPEAILILGRRLWRNMDDEDAMLLESSDPLQTVVGYRLADGRMIPALHIRHPSSAGFSGVKLSAEVRAFLASTRLPH